MSDELVQELWKIKGDRTFAEMADEIDGLSEDGLWRIMKGNRGGLLDTWQKILAAYPHLMPLFLSQNPTVVGAETTTVGGDSDNA